MVRIGVVGANGRLGSMMVETLQRHDDVEVVAISSIRRPQWPDSVVHHRFDGTMGSPQELRSVLSGIDALISAAPSRDADLHAVAIESGCHVMDVSVQLEVIKRLLALDELARSQRRSLIAMAGLIGLTGLAGLELTERAPQAASIQICLIQSANGSAGEHGTREMIDMLTERHNRFHRRVRQSPGQPTVTQTKLFNLASAETDILAGDDKLAFATGFDSPGLNAVIRALAGIRAVAPPVYRTLRDAVARRKATAREATEEDVELSAVALGSAGVVAGWNSLRFDSDYGATAAIACSTAMMAQTGNLRAGAGHLSDFVRLADLIDHPVMRKVVLASAARDL